MRTTRKINLCVPARGTAIFAIVGVILACVEGLGNETMDLHAAGAEGSINLDQWRSAENDGKNCLYVQLRTLGYKKTYEEYITSIEANNGDIRTFAGLTRIAELQGYHLSTVATSVEEISRARVPAIVQLEERERGGTYFGLYINSDDSNVYLLDGPMVRLAKMTQDRFRRSWSGYAIVPTADSLRYLIAGRLLLVALVGWFIMELAWTGMSTRLTNSKE
jgi:hypothetical protein